MDYTSIAILPVRFLQNYYLHIFKEILIVKSGRIKMLKKKMSLGDLCCYMHSLFTVMTSGKSFGKCKVGEIRPFQYPLRIAVFISRLI